MSVQAVTWGLKQKTGSPSAKAVLLALANYAGHDGDCYPSQEILANNTEQSIDSVQRRLHELEQKGLIYRCRRHGRNGWRRSDEIILLMDDRTKLAAGKLGWQDCEIGEALSATPESPRDMDGDHDSPSQDQQTTPQIAALAKAADYGSGLSRNGPEPTPHLCGSMNPNMNPNTSPLPPQGGVGQVLSRWERFENAYPFDPDDRKASAKRALERLSPDDQELAIAAAPRYAERCRQKNVRTAYAARWLREKGWQNFEARVEMQVASADFQIFVEKGSKEWVAWQEWLKRVRGRGSPALEFKSHGGKLGWRFPSKWPPGANLLEPGIVPSWAAESAAPP